MTGNANAVMMTSMREEVVKEIMVAKMETIQAKMRKTTKIMTARKALIIPVIRAADRMTIQVLKANIEELTTRIQAAVMTRVMTPPVKRIEEVKAPATTDRDTIIRAMMRKGLQAKGAAVKHKPLTSQRMLRNQTKSQKKIWKSVFQQCLTMYVNFCGNASKK